MHKFKTASINWIRSTFRTSTSETQRHWVLESGPALGGQWGISRKRDWDFALGKGVTGTTAWWAKPGEERTGKTLAVQVAEP